MKARYRPRVAVNGAVVFSVNGFTGEGKVLDLCVPGCLIESPFSLKRGQFLTLRLRLPQVSASFSVPLAVVRWMHGMRFGVEFIEMEQRERQRFNAFVSALLEQQEANDEGPAWHRS